MTADADTVAELDDNLLEAYFDDALTYQWYLDDVEIPGATSQSLLIPKAYEGHTLKATITGGTTTLTGSNKVMGEVTSVTISGSITSFGDAAARTTVELWKGTTKTYTVSGTSSYSINGVAAGTYTVMVMKKNHVTRTYEITVGTDTVTQDVKIHLKGDISGDGRITTIDFVRANSHARGVTLLTEYELLCADVVGTDGSITTADAMRINAHAKGTSLLW